MRGLQCISICVYRYPDRFLVLTFCINAKRGRGGHESPRWIRALRKGDGRANRTFGSHPLKTQSSHGDNTDPWRGPLAVLNGSTDDVSILRPPYLCRWLYRTCSLPYWSHADTSPNTDPWRGPLAVLNGSTDDVSILRPPYLCRWLCRTRSLPYWSHADTSPNTSGDFKF
jgi:hypothetical protein